MITNTANAVPSAESERDELERLRAENAVLRECASALPLMVMAMGEAGDLIAQGLVGVINDLSDEPALQARVREAIGPAMARLGAMIETTGERAASRAH